LVLMKLFKLKFQSYVKKINSYKKIFLFNRTNSYISSHYHWLCSYFDSIRESRPNKQRWGRW